MTPESVHRVVVCVADHWLWCDGDAPAGADGLQVRRVGHAAAADHESFSLALTNQTAAPLPVDVYAPLLAGLVNRGFTAYVPHAGGAVFPVKDANFLIHSLGQLTSLFLILHSEAEDGGIVIAQEKSSEDEGRYRTGLNINGKGLPKGEAAEQIQGRAGSLIDTARADVGEDDLGGIASLSCRTWWTSRCRFPPPCSMTA